MFQLILSIQWGPNQYWTPLNFFIQTKKQKRSIFFYSTKEVVTKKKQKKNCHLVIHAVASNLALPQFTLVKHFLVFFLDLWFGCWSCQQVEQGKNTVGLPRGPRPGPSKKVVVCDSLGNHNFLRILSQGQVEYTQCTLPFKQFTPSTYQ